jgi:hypothetical protein
LCFQLAVWSGRKPKGDSVGRAAVARARANPATGRDAPAASCVERSRQRERHARADGGRAGLVRRARCAALMIDF